MSYSAIGKESNVGPWVSTIRYASTTAKEFNPSSLGLRWPGRAYAWDGAPIAAGLGSYGDTMRQRTFTKSARQGLGDLFDSLKSIIGPSIGAGIQAFEARATSMALQNPAVQKTGAQAALALVKDKSPVIIVSLAALAGLALVTRRRR